MRKRLRPFFLVVPIAMPFFFFDTSVANGQQAIPFGPEIFTRATDDPQQFVRNFAASPPFDQYTIAVQNGEGRDGSLSSAVVELNGVRIVGPQDFTEEVDLIIRNVTLQAENTLNIELRSAPGRSVVVTAHGQFPSASQVIPATGGSVDLAGFAFATFPDGAFSVATRVDVSVSNSSEIHERFSAATSAMRLPYEIRINSGNVSPRTSVDVILNVPVSFVTTLPQNHQLEIFAQPIETGTDEALGHFYRFASTFDPATNTLSATLPTAAFTNESSPDESYEAILIVAAIPSPLGGGGGPHGSTPGRSRASAKIPVTLASLSLNLFGLLFAAGPICEGSPLYSPLEGTPIVRDPYNPPSHGGTDYRAPLGANVYPVLPGRVTRVGWDIQILQTPNPRTGGMIRGWGRYVVITHDPALGGDGSQTLYGHLIPESTGHLVPGVTEVLPTDVIGQVGTSGGVTGPHLHLEYSPAGQVRGGGRSVVDPDPCVQAGLTLVLSPETATLTCPSGTVTFTATGGKFPYTWSTTKGVITPSSHTRSATLAPPENPGSMLGGTAYRKDGAHTFAMFGCATCDTPIFDGRTGAGYGCNGQFLRCGVAEGCRDGTPNPCTPGAQHMMCSIGACPGLPVCMENLCTELQQRGRVCDTRTPEMIRDGCKPCFIEMQGAVVTVRDANGTPATARVTPQ